MGSMLFLAVALGDHSTLDVRSPLSGALLTQFESLAATTLLVVNFL